MHSIASVVHITAAVLLILVILMQSGRGAGISGIFGGGGAEQLFSAPSGGSFLRKATMALAIVFVLTSISITVISSRRELTSVTTTQR